MTSDWPVLMQWQGDGFTPANQYWAKQCDKRFVVGETYSLEEINERSMRSHDHQFKWLNEAWKNLPEEYANMFPTPMHLRKRALIDAGFYNETVVHAGSQDAALEFAATIQARDEFALVVIQDGYVVIRDAKSQSRKSMKKAEFQDSKTKIMEIVADMLGITPDQLLENTGKAA